jgi:pyruvate formate lyase activating enzyme
MAEDATPSSGRAGLRANLLVAVTALGVVVATGMVIWIISRFPPPSTIQAFSHPENPQVQPARYWRTVCAGVQCTLCPFRCFLPEGARGRCRVRMNVAGQLVTLVYASPVSVHIDPMEKKPVFHMLPGSMIYSLATVGCNLKCDFCQNWEISQSYPEQVREGTVIPREVRFNGFSGGQPTFALRQDVARILTPEEVVQAALATGCRSIAYTYSEPVVFFEYVLATAKLAKAKGLRNVMVSGGYIEPEPLAELAPYFDVVKVDLKGFNEDFYRSVVGGELRFVLRTLIELKKRKVLTEVVNLVVPTLNDRDADFRVMTRWVHENLGADTPLFFSRFMPQYRLQNLPDTPVDTLERAWHIAQREGLHYVYVGNVPGHPGESTYCPRCGHVLIRRQGYAILENHIGKDGKCPYCGKKIPGIWS